MNIRESLEWFAEQGTFHVSFFTGHANVQIPEHLQGPPICILKFSKLFAPGGNANLEVTNSLICQTLSFQGTEHYCVVPLEAIIHIWNDTHRASQVAPGERDRNIVEHPPESTKPVDDSNVVKVNFGGNR